MAPIKPGFPRKSATCVLFLVFLLIIKTAHGQEKLNLVSTAFAEGKAIPGKYTCAGQDVSPGFSWDGVPNGTKSFAIIMDDPDAPMGVWVHWVIYNIPDTIRVLKENFTTQKVNAADGLNDWESKGYKGPCPPDGQHRYVFKLYALDTMLNVVPDMTKYKLEDAMKGHILGVGQLKGVFQL
jgi:hypothetical protein